MISYIKSKHSHKNYNKKNKIINLNITLKRSVESVYKNYAP